MYVRTFIVVEMQNPILGADFLKANNIIVDSCHECLIDGETLYSTKGEIREVSKPTNVHLITRQNIQEVASLNYSRSFLHLQNHHNS